MHAELYHKHLRCSPSWFRAKIVGCRPRVGDAFHKILTYADHVSAPIQIHHSIWQSCVGWFSIAFCHIPNTCRIVYNDTTGGYQNSPGLGPRRVRARAMPGTLQSRHDSWPIVKGRSPRKPKSEALSLAAPSFFLSRPKISGRGQARSQQS